MLNCILVLLSVLSLSSCDKFLEKKGDAKLNDDKLIETKPMFDRKKFIAQSKLRSDGEKEFGPDALDYDNPKLRDKSQTFISKEESYDTVDIEENFAKDDFKVSLKADNLDIRVFAEMLSKATGVNIIVSDEVDGDITTELKDVPWTKLLDTVLQIKSLAKHVDGKSNIVRIHGQNKIAELEEFEKKRQEISSVQSF